ncbi:UDP-N-acetylglucosamine 2-epimerase (non-hydrolyzing) [Candidatus Sumerlaeota bacterium]|nr:UDP-N-acetylglucosamine 2-epimerase (non-hydrolyzing) [Candidatus Sumerlaeota bacterium]
MVKIINVVGARPNFMKIAPLMDAFREYEDLETVLVHTGQHYDEQMNDLFFNQLEIPRPQINLQIGSASHAVQTAEIMKAFEKVVLEEKPDAVLVVGDVNSTIACGLVTVKLGVKLIHVEAGLRSNDRSMPEEINRILTDSISDMLFCTEQQAVENLRREGVSPDRIFLTGNVMIDTLLRFKSKIQQSTILERIEVREGSYAVLTLHRPSNVDDPEQLERIICALETVQRELPVIFPIHPRTQKNLEVWDLNARINEAPNLHIIPPLGYLDFHKLLEGARLALTDSGGIQEEALILKIPCVTLRENTERPITIEMGGNCLAGSDPERIVAAARRVLNGNGRSILAPPLWDGMAARRIARLVYESLTQKIAPIGMTQN